MYKYFTGLKGILRFFSDKKMPSHAKFYLIFFLIFMQNMENIR
ncbi:hypothetical protein HMPREF1022_02065 [Desulfovibrio sp. 6_1_46AFAA]|nr:hypothetical protein HMPREF1022_02065 [Desulfovibrio sp. 6_1_46AFAA]